MKEYLKNRKKTKILVVATLVLFVLCVIMTGVLNIIRNSPSHDLVVFRDRSAPVVQVKGAVSLNGRKYEVEDFIDNIYDLTDVSARFLVEPDYSREGTQDIIIRFTDEAGNFTDRTASLEVYNDVTAPWIYGDDIEYVYIGDAVSYKSFVAVEDDFDDNCQLDIDNSQVDLNEPGYYEVIYTATDSAGNSRQKVTGIVVMEPDTDEYYLMKANELCDKIIDQIIKPGMDDLHKVWAVYEYVRSIPYQLTEYTRNYIREGYKMLKNYSGDCYGSYASVRLLLDRLEIDNIPIQTDENFTRHFWNMVSLDGGSTWYHVDATNWTEWEYKPVMCMISDAKLNEISGRHGGTHIHIEYDYPATPYYSMPIPEDIASGIEMQGWELNYY